MGNETSSIGNDGCHGNPAKAAAIASMQRQVNEQYGAVLTGLAGIASGSTQKTNSNRQRPPW